jgi:hypothetical protein
MGISFAQFPGSSPSVSWARSEQLNTNMQNHIKFGTVKMIDGTPPALRGLSEMNHQSSLLKHPVARRRIEDQARQFIHDRLVQEFRRVSTGKIKFIQ